MNADNMQEDLEETMQVEALNETSNKRRQRTMGPTRALNLGSSSTTAMTTASPPPNVGAHHDDALGTTETRLVHFLRLVFGVILVAATTLVAAGMYRLTKHDEQVRFESHVRVQSARIAQTIHRGVSERIEALDSMASTITSIAKATDQEFPFVTIPDFDVRGSATRVGARSHVLHYMPVVHDHNREAWEEYAMEHRGHIDVDYENDAMRRRRQDETLGYPLLADHENIAWKPKQYENTTVLSDGSNYHPKIWSSGQTFPEGDIPKGNGPYLPSWHRSPVNIAKQERLNVDVNRNPRLAGALSAILEKRQAIMHKASVPGFKKTPLVVQNFMFSQFRHEDFSVFGSDPFTFVAYPVMESFEPNAKVAAVLSSAMYWRLLFASSMPDEGAGPFVCVIENSFNQTLTYRVEGQNVTFLGKDDHHDTKYDSLGKEADVMEAFQQRQSTATMSYTNVGLNTEYSRYTLKIYPTVETEVLFATDKPWLYAWIVVAIFGFSTLLFMVLMYFVERRQRLVMRRVVESGAKAAAAERDLNEFLAHEIRNPLSSAILAHSFIMSTIESNPNAIPDARIREAIQSDERIIKSSLAFIDDFLKSVLLLYRSTANRLELAFAPTNLSKAVFERVADILHPRNGEDVRVIVECPEELTVMTDRLRLEQVLLNLGQNSSKFVSHGFIRLRGYINSYGLVEISVEDSGPGINPNIREFLFQKYHTSLDVVTQGNGIGLSLCQRIVSLLKGDIWLDDTYQSDVPGCPGSRFVVSLNQLPLETCGGSTTSSVGDTNNSTERHIESVPSVAPTDLSDVELPESLSVLFVDDDAVLRKLFIRCLGKLCPHWDIQGAGSGEAALEILTQPNVTETGDIEDQIAHPSSDKQFDLIFIDQYMSSSSEPQLLGTETVQAMRDRGIDCTICGLSANDLSKDFLEKGADYFILKPLPCEPRALREELLRITGRIRRKCA